MDRRAAAAAALPGVGRCQWWRTGASRGAARATRLPLPASPGRCWAATTAVATSDRVPRPAKREASKLGFFHPPPTLSPSPCATAVCSRQLTAVSGETFPPSPSSPSHCPAGGSTNWCVSRYSGCRGDPQLLWQPPYSEHRRGDARVGCPAGVGLAAVRGSALSARPPVDTPGVEATNACRGVLTSGRAAPPVITVCGELPRSSLPFPRPSYGAWGYVPVAMAAAGARRAHDSVSTPHMPSSSARGPATASPPPELSGVGRNNKNGCHEGVSIARR